MATKDNQTSAGNQVSRRRFVQGSGALAAGLMAAPAILKGTRATASGVSLFTLGVVSGDPGPRSVVLWTRLAPDPLNGGGLPNAPIDVTWEIATDEGFANVVGGGVVTALPGDGHAVHVVADNLPPNSWLYYRFSALGETSRVGRTRTFPAVGQAVPRMRFAVVSCQNYEQGYYPAWADIAAWRGRGDEDLDFVIHTGDYIYESGGSSSPILPGRVHVGGEIFSVDDYRNRYAQYRLDPALQDAHANFPFLVTWDDHEVDNNYAGQIAEEGAPFQGPDFVQRRKNAYQVYAETMPLRAQNRIGARRGYMRLFRRLRFGALADIHMLDTRQFRSDQPAGDGFGSTDPDTLGFEAVFGETLFDADGILDPAATMTGRVQENWLTRGLTESTAQWNVIAQQVMVTKWDVKEAGRLTIANDPTIPGFIKDQLLAAYANVDNLYNVDAWDGYQAARDRLFNVLDSVRPSNPVVLTGDIHSAWAANLLKDFSDPNSDILAAEFVCTSISSTFAEVDPRTTHLVVKASVAVDNPHIPYFNGLFRGYSLCDVDGSRFQNTFRAVGDPADLGNPDPLALVPQETSPVQTDGTFEIASGFNAPSSGVRITGSARVLPAPF